MTASPTPQARRLPARPSLESLRKQAKALARGVAAGDAGAIARARAQLTAWTPPLAQRDAQLVLAREYGFAGWQALRQEVLNRAGAGLEWAALQAERAIHADDLDGLRRLLAEHPALLAWRGDDGATLLGAAATAFGDAGDPGRERRFTRPASAELLLDAGAVVEPALWRNVIRARAAGMLRLLWRKGVLPRAPVILAALGELEGLRAGFDDAAAEQAFMAACRFRQPEAAAFLLDRCIALDAALGERIAGWRGRAAFIDYLGAHPQDFGAPWRTLVVNEVLRTIEEDDLAGFAHLLDSEPQLLDDTGLEVQVEIIERATLHDRAAFIQRLLALDPAILRRPEPPRSSAILFAIEYGHAHLVPALSRIWPLPDDLPHAAGLGDLDRVRRWFDDAGRPALGALTQHYPANNPDVRGNLRWGAGSVQ